MQHLGLKARKNVMNVYITPMIEAGLLEMTEPDNPTSRNQMYVAAKNIEKAKKFDWDYIWSIYNQTRSPSNFMKDFLFSYQNNNVYRYGYIPLCPFCFQ